jgi:DNA-nicking Smr family endonuclease
MSRRLTRDERELWDRLRHTVRPLRKRRTKETAEPEKPKLDRAVAKASPAPKHRAAAPASVAPRPPSLQPLDERARRRLARGLTEVDARIDLHGMRQERAFRALAAFLRKSQARGVRVGLVITGKGRAGDEERGVLYQAVPLWLARPEFRDFVVGFEPASRRHGGAGALYVRIRQRRAARPPA